MRTRSLALKISLVAVAVLFQGTAQAANFVLDETNGEFQQLTASYFQSLFNFIPIGSELVQVALHEGNITGPISDILEFTYTATLLTVDIRIQFISEEEGGPALVPTAQQVANRIETCDCLINYTNTVAGLGTNVAQVIRVENIRIFAKSDCDSPCEVTPEPSTTSLLTEPTLFLIGLALPILRRRANKSRVAAAVPS